MRKETKYKIVSVLLLIVPLVTLGALAQPITGGTARTIVLGIASIFGWITAVVSIAMLAVGLFRLATSEGEARAMGEAKISIIWALIGGVLAISLFSMETILTWFGFTLA